MFDPGLPQQSDHLTAGRVKEDLHVQRQGERGHLRDQRWRGLRDQEVQGAGLHRRQEPAHIKRGVPPSMEICL